MASTDSKPDWLTDLDSECERVRAALRKHFDGTLCLEVTPIGGGEAMFKFDVESMVFIESSASVEREVRRLLESLLGSLPTRKVK